MLGIERLKPNVGPQIDLQRFADSDLAMRLYGEVGRDWAWNDRSHWGLDDWTARVDQPDVEFYAAYRDGKTVGYFELERQGEETQIAYFGLLPEFIGQGLGGSLLTKATETAFANGERRVWLHTCTLDAPAALPNYLARGFVEFKRETKIIDGQAEKSG
ncbi:MAG: GNAT family N-acetyltransferase [Armatimonadetes bacterium]|nr:GNAT family N-acetyltransferase [Armatimonadota bacterium]